MSWRYTSISLCWTIPDKCTAHWTDHHGHRWQGFMHPFANFSMKVSPWCASTTVGEPESSLSTVLTVRVAGIVGCLECKAIKWAKTIICRVISRGTPNSECVTIGAIINTDTGVSYLSLSAISKGQLNTQFIGLSLSYAVDIAQPKPKVTRVASKSIFVLTPTFRTEVHRASSTGSISLHNDGPASSRCEHVTLGMKPGGVGAEWGAHTRITDLIYTTTGDWKQTCQVAAVKEWVPSSTGSSTVESSELPKVCCILGGTLLCLRIVRTRWTVHHLSKGKGKQEDSWGQK